MFLFWLLVQVTIITVAAHTRQPLYDVDPYQMVVGMTEGKCVSYDENVYAKFTKILVIPSLSPSIDLISCHRGIRTVDSNQAEEKGTTVDHENV